METLLFKILVSKVNVHKVRANMDAPLMKVLEARPNSIKFLTKATYPIFFLAFKFNVREVRADTETPPFKFFASKVNVREVHANTDTPLF